MKISKHNIINVLICSVFFPPFFITYLPMASNIHWIVKLLVMAFIVLVVIRENKYLGLGSAVIALYFLSFIVSTALNSGNVMKSVSAVLPQICFLLYVDWMLHKNPSRIVGSMSSLLKFYIIANAVTLLFFPDGIGRYLPGYDYMSVDSRMNWLGLDNGYIKYFLIAIVLFSFSMKGKNLYRNIWLCIMLATMIFVWSGTGVIVLFFILAYMFFISKKKVSRYIDFRLCTLLGILAFLGIVIFRATDIFSNYIVNYLGKDITFTGRTLLWDQSMLLISKRPVIGYGVYDYELLISSANGQAYSAHNTVLQMMLMGGIISLLCFILIFCVAGHRLSESKRALNCDVSVENGIICIAILAMWICGLAENMVFDIQIYILLLFAIDFKYLVQVYESYNTDKNLGY